MKTRFLFPHRFKKIGWALFIPSAIVGLIMICETQISWMELNCRVFAIAHDSGYFSFIENDISDEIVGILIILGAILCACSEEKNEDEFVAKIRLESLLWATYINYALIIFCLMFVYGLSFLTVMECNLVTLLIIFLIRFNYILYKTKKLAEDEK